MWQAFASKCLESFHVGRSESYQHTLSQPCILPEDCLCRALSPQGARVPAGAHRQLWWPQYQHIHQQLFILSYRTHTMGPSLTGGQGNVLNSRAAPSHTRPVTLCNLSLLSTPPLHPAVARYNIILCPDSGTCCRQFEIKTSWWGT